MIVHGSKLPLFPRRSLVAAWRWSTLPLVLAFVVACGSDNGDGPTQPETGTVAGVVVGPQDQGVAGASLTLSRTGESSRNATSGSDGAFTFQNVPVGSWSLSVTPPGGWEIAQGEPSQRSVTVSAGATAQASFALAPVLVQGQISGTVTHDGHGVGQVQLVLDDGQGGVTERTTDNSGAFTFPELAPGDYELSITPPGYFQLAQGQDAVRNITLESGAGANVQVTLTPTTAQQVHEIQLGEASFTPSQLTVSPGARIRWVNQYDIGHTVTPSGHSAWSRQEMSAAGQTFEVVLNNPGDFAYYCEPHQAVGMTGTIAVNP